MPNHVHLLITLEGEAGHAGPALQSGRTSIPEIIRWYKTMTVNDWIRAVKTGVLPPFERTIWQTSFYDHVVRNQRDYETIWQYIDENPMKWKEDIYYKEDMP